MKKMIAGLMCLLMGLSTFTGCGNTSSASSSTGSAAAANSAGNQDTNLKANLRVLYPGTTDLEKEIATEMQTELKKKYPNINVEYLFLSWSDIEKKLAVMTQSNDYPDVMQVQDVTNAVAMGALEPIQPYIEKSKDYKMSMFSQVGLKADTVKGTLYAAPFSLIPYSHIVNKDLFKSVGIDPTSMKSWDDVEAAVAKIGGTGASGFAMANGGEGRFCFRDFMMMALSNGFTPNDTSAQTKQKYIETLEFVKKMASYMPKSESTWQYPELYKAWGTGKVGMMHTGTYFTANAVAHGTQSLDFTQVVPMPAGPSSVTKKPVLMVGSNAYAIVAGSKQKEAAWKFIEVALSEPVLGKLCGSLNIPAVNYISDATLKKYAEQEFSKYGSEVGDKHITLMKEFQKAANEYGVPMPSIVGQPAMEKVVQGALVKVIDGSLSPAQAYDQIKKGIDQVKASA